MSGWRFNPDQDRNKTANNWFHLRNTCAEKGNVAESPNRQSLGCVTTITRLDTHYPQQEAGKGTKRWRSIFRAPGACTVTTLLFYTVRLNWNWTLSLHPIHQFIITRYCGTSAVQWQWKCSSEYWKDDFQFRPLCFQTLLRNRNKRVA